MRTVMLLLCLVFLAQRGLCQQTYLRMPPVAADTSTDTAEADDEELLADQRYLSYYYQGIAYYDKGLYAKAEEAFRAAFALERNEELARYLYYTLIYQGQDLQAAAFKARHSQYAFTLPPTPKGLESVYADIGVRFSARPANAGNIFYTNLGAYFRLSPTKRLWQSAAFLQQNDNLGYFKQLEYHAGLTTYLRHGWTVAPTFNFAYVPYTTRYTAVDSVFYISSFRAGQDTWVYRTRACQSTGFDIPGKAAFYNLSLPVSKRAGAFNFGLDPAVHYWPGHGQIGYQYTSVGITDSFQDNHYRGSKPFHESGSGKRDTVTDYFAMQVGATITWRPPLKGAPLSLSAAAYYLRDETGRDAFAWSVFALLWWHQDYRFFLTCLNKGNLPLSVSAAGWYLNFNDPVNVRASASFQWRPLKRWSPMVTYQYEHNTRLQDGATLIYHSGYVTLKYNL